MHPSPPQTVQLHSEQIHYRSAPARDDAPSAPSRAPGLLHALRHPMSALQSALSVEFDFDGCVLCDEGSIHADLVELFERREVPSA